MSMNAIAGYAHAFGLGSYGFSNPIPSQTASQQGPTSSVGSLRPQTQTSNLQSADDGNDSEDAFAIALQQISQQMNPSLQGASNAIAMGTKSINGMNLSELTQAGTSFAGTGSATTSGTTASGSGTSSTSSTAGANATDTDSSISTQTALPFFPWFGGSQFNNFGGGQTGSSAAASASSLGSFFGGSSQVGQATSAPSAVASLPGTPNSISELTSLLGSSSSSTLAGGGFGAWAQGVEQNMLSALL